MKYTAAVTAAIVWNPPCVKTEEGKDHRLYHVTPPGRDTGKGYKYRFLFILFPTTCFTSVFVFITNSYYVFADQYYHYHSQTPHQTL